MNRKTLTATATAITIGATALFVAACGEDEQDITGTWKGSFSGYTLVGDSGRNDTQSPIEVTIGKVDGNAFTATITFPVTGAKGTVKTKVPGVVSSEEDDLWMAGADGYYVGEVDGDEMELVYLKSFTIDPGSADGIENVAQSGTFERSK
jgi:hypothetical protein